MAIGASFLRERFALEPVKAENLPKGHFIPFYNGCGDFPLKIKSPLPLSLRAAPSLQRAGKKNSRSHFICGKFWCSSRGAFWCVLFYFFSDEKYSIRVVRKLFWKENPFWGIKFQKKQKVLTKKIPEVFRKSGAKRALKNKKIAKWNKTQNGESFLWT